MEFGSVSVLASLFALALIASVIDTIAGGGGLLVVPGLMMTGLDPISAFATTKLQAIFGTSSAAIQFWRKGRVRFRSHVVPAFIAFFASMGGAVSLSYLDPSILKAIVPFLLIFVALIVLFKPDLGKVPRQARLSFLAGSLTLIPLVGFYDGFFGPGTGTFFVLSGVTFLGLGFEEATIRAKIYNFMSNLGGLTFFIWSGHTAWTYGAVMALGTIIGGNLGARLVMRHGIYLIKPLLVITSAAMSLKLLWQQEVFQHVLGSIDAFLQQVYSLDPFRLSVLFSWLLDYLGLADAF